MPDETAELGSQADSRSLADPRLLMEEIAKTLVDAPEQVRVEAIEDAQGVELQLSVASADVGRIIGKHGRTARSLRAVLDVAADKLQKNYSLEIME